MGRTKAKDGDDFQSELEFHRREWLVQRIGWVGIALFLLIALAGLFGGGGPLTDVRSANDAGSIHYDRYTRRAGRTTLTVTPAAAPDADRVELSITHSYTQVFKIEQITPEPTRVRSAGERLVFEFEASSPGAPISFHLEPERIGRHWAQIMIDGSTPLEIHQLTYP